MGGKQEIVEAFSKKIGILGGGQLGRMILQEAAKYNFDLYILDKDPNAPCKAFCAHFQVGDLMDYDAVIEFGKSLDIITIEIEHVNADALAALEKMGKEVYPSSNVLKTIQDKGLQKQFFRLHSLPTSEYRLIDAGESIADHADFLPSFQKLRKFGYDGKGVQELSSKDDLSKAFTPPSVLEKAVDIEKEISVIVAVNKKGQLMAYPPVELVFDPDLNLVDYLLSPAELSEDQIKEANHLAIKLVKAFGCAGIFAIEMFLSKSGKILINEVAPRPHNSGHHTFEGNITSQFEQHLRAIANWPLGNTDIRSTAVMLNILGEKGYEGEAKYQGLDKVLEMEGVFVHLYGKKFTRPGRKMGHVSIIGANKKEIFAKMQTVKQQLKVVA